AAAVEIGLGVVRIELQCLIEIGECRDEFAAQVFVQAALVLDRVLAHVELPPMLRWPRHCNRCGPPSRGSGVPFRSPCARLPSQERALCLTARLSGVRTMAAPLPLFPTTVVGSMPRPQYLKDLLASGSRTGERDAGWQKRMDDAVRFVID